jgi:hypothetical protein
VEVAAVIAAVVFAVINTANAQIGSWTVGAAPSDCAPPEPALPGERHGGKR